jgi:hypothetical protein
MKQKKATLMAKTLGSQTLSISIDCQPARVCEFVSNPENLPKWTKAFCKSVTKSNDDWIMQTPRGSIKVRFVETNGFGEPIRSYIFGPFSTMR